MLRAEYVQDVIEKGQQGEVDSQAPEDKYPGEKGYTSGNVLKISIPDQIRMWPFLLALNTK
jgi:hypothetical protein